MALALVDGGNRLLIANRDSGTVAAVDTSKLQVVAETPVGRRLSDMTAAKNGDVLLITDEQAAELVVLAHREGSLREVRRIPVGVSPVSVRVTDHGKLVTVACLWPRRLMILDLAEIAKGGKPLTPPAPIDLPFAPRRQLPIPGTSKLIVADSFAGKLAVVDLRKKKIESVRDLPIHNIRGLALDPGGKSMVLTHQVLHARGHTTAGEIRTSNLITNNVRRLSLAAVLDPLADVHRDERVYSLGDVELGAGDPAEVVESYDGRLLVTVAGVNELFIGRPEEVIWTRLPVGRRPTALAVDSVRKRAYVTNTFADSISVVDLQVPKVIAEISLEARGDSPKLRSEERGEMLFYDARLSSESWFSCNSCHPDGHTSGRLNDNFSDGSFGTPKRVLSLLGVKDTGPWAWNGKMPDLETQVRTSLKSTMVGPAPSAEQVRDLTAFLQSLPAPPSLTKARGTYDAEAHQRGQALFKRLKCAACHTPDPYTSAKTYDVGLRDEAGETHFNPPSLRGLSQGGPYFHDGRAGDLREVFSRYKHQVSGKLAEKELADLLEFLNGL